MTLGPFQTAIAHRTPVSVELEPALNALNSLALLNAVERLPALDSWVRSTATALSPAQRHANRLLLDLLGGALVARGEWPDFPAYLTDLAAQPPVLLRDRALRQLLQAAPPEEATGAAELLLADQQAFADYLSQRSPGDAPDAALLQDAYSLLSDPPALREAALRHLRALWEEHLAAEWQRAMKGLDAEMKGFLHHLRNNTTTTVENLRTFVGGELIESVTAQGEPVRRIVFVPSPHTGRHVTRLAYEGTLWLFFHAPRNFAVLWRQAQVGQQELMLRLNALADQTRLRILELFAEQDELTQQEIQDRLELSQSTASRQLKALSPYLVERRGEGASKYYRLSPAQFDLTFRTLKRLTEGARPEEHDARRDAGDLRRFMDRRGRITMFPTRPRDQLMVLEFIAEQFEPGRSYTEKDVNELISRHLAYDDFVTVRRELYDHMFLGRERDGSRYWRIDPAERAKHYPA